MKKIKDIRIRFLKDFVVPLKYEFILSFVLVMLTLFAQLYFPLGVRRAIDNGIINNNVRSLLREISIILLVGFFQSFFNYFKYIKINKAMNFVSYNIKFAIMSKIQRCSMHFFVNSKPGEIASIVERDVEQIEDIIFTVLFNIIIQVCSFIVVMIILLFMNWKIAIYALIASPFFALFQFSLGKKIKTIYKNIRENIADINDYTQDWIESCINIQLFNYGKTIEERYKEKHLNKIESLLKTSRISGIVNIVGQVINTIGIVMILYFGGIDVFNGVITVGTITALTIYIQRVYSPLAQIMQGVIKIQNSSIILNRIYSLIDCEDIIKDGEIDINKPLKGNIRIDNVSFSYGKRKILNDISMQINGGEIIGLVGKNGVGKSTIAKLLTRLYEADEGRIYIDEVEIRHYRINKLRDELVYLQSNPYIFNGTIKENILLDKVNNFDMNKLYEIINQVGLKDDINNMKKGINTLIKTHTTNLSTGQCQKISLARVLVKNPSIVILDEPTSSLDIETEKEITLTIKQVFTGKTLIIISHREEILKICDKVYTIKNLKLKEEKNYRI